MAKVMMTIQSESGPPAIEEIMQRYSLSAEEIDGSFGAVEIDPKEHLYTILVEEGAAAKVQPSAGWKVEGPFANPRIEPFGPPKP